MLNRRMSTKQKDTPDGATKRKSIWGGSAAKTPTSGLRKGLGGIDGVAEDTTGEISGRVATVENALTVIMTEEISRALQSFTGIPAKELKELISKHINQGWQSSSKGKRILIAGEREQALVRLNTLKFLAPADVGRSATPLRFPLHTAMPPTNLFGDKQVDSTQRLLAIIEAWFMTFTSIDRARRFQPTKGDVWVVAGPQSGENYFARIVRYLLSDKPLEVWHDQHSTAPWIESYHVNEDPDLLKRPQYRRGRVFRTALTTEFCGVRRNKDLCKYIIVVRNPIDLRASWIDYLRACYNVESEYDLPPFDEVFDVDDFANEAVTLCEPASGGKPKTYEEFVARWLQEEQSLPKQVKVVCYEALAADPEREVMRLVDFLGVVDYKGLVPVILRDLAREGIEKTQPAAGAAAAKGKKTDKAPPAAAGGVTGKRRPSLGAGGAVFSDAAQNKLKLAFANNVSDKMRSVDSYEKLYEKYGGSEPYPFPLEKSQKKARAAGEPAVKKAALKLVDDPKPDGQAHTFRRIGQEPQQQATNNNNNNKSARPISVGLTAAGKPLPPSVDNPAFAPSAAAASPAKARPKSTNKIEIVNGVPLRRLVPAGDVDEPPPPADDDDGPPPPPDDEPVAFAAPTKKIDLKARLAAVKSERAAKTSKPGAPDDAPPPPADDDDDAPPPPPEDD